MLQAKLFIASNQGLHLDGCTGRRFEPLKAKESHRDYIQLLMPNLFDLRSDVSSNLLPADQESVAQPTELITRRASCAFVADLEGDRVYVCCDYCTLWRPSPGGNLHG